MTELITWLHDIHFYDEGHKICYKNEAYESLSCRGVVIFIESLAEWLKKTDDEEFKNMLDRIKNIDKNVLNLPILQLRLDSLLTILKDIDEYNDLKSFSENDEELTRWKQTLIDIRLAEQYSEDSDEKLKLTKQGEYLLKDEFIYLYDNFLNHLCKRFPDFVELKKLARKYKPETIDEFLLYIKMKKLVVPTSTTKNFFHLLCEVGILKIKDNVFPYFLENEKIEYTHFYKILKALWQHNKDDWGDLKVAKIYQTLKEIEEKYKTKSLSQEEIKKYLKYLEIERKIKLYQINSCLAKDPNDYIKIEDKFYYNMVVTND